MACIPRFSPATPMPCVRLLVFVLLLFAGSAQARPGLTPTATVKEAVGEVLNILKNEDFDREQRWTAIGRVIDARFDFRSMSQSVLASNWQSATVEEKRRFVEFFSQYLEDTYRTKIESYTNQSMDYVDEQIRNDRATVDTFIVTDSNRIPVTYRLKNNDGEWFAYDVIIEGVSLVNNYRNTFNAIIKAEGMDGLLLDLQGRISDYKEKHGGLPPE
ncbi:MAG: ABC transporter substrate-binding protein [Gammaproteobacteria bacterium]|nr:ABC transporter substrate-binding protein [Gammaproteobacteria bacterium]